MPFSQLLHILNRHQRLPLDLIISNPPVTSTTCRPPSPTRRLAAPTTTPPARRAPTDATDCYHRDLDTRVESTLNIAYLKGRSTRRMEGLVTSLGINGMPKSLVSTSAENLESMETGTCLHLSADALTIKVRKGVRAKKASVLLATVVYT